MHKTYLRKVGGSVMLVVPRAVLESLHLHVGSMVGLAVDHGRLIIEPTSKLRYTLDELLAQCDVSAEVNAEDRAWLDSKPAGEELL